MSVLPSNLSIEKLDRAQQDISDHIAGLRSLASDYAKRCSLLKEVSVNHQTDVQQLAQLLELISRDSATAEHTSSTTETQVVQELLQTFHHWTGK